MYYSLYIFKDMDQYSWMADSITYGQLKTGVNAVGMGNAGTSAAQKLGLGLGTAVFGWVMSGAGFKGEYDCRAFPSPPRWRPPYASCTTGFP